MSTAENKAIALDLFARLMANDIQGALDTMTEDATWRIAGKPHSNPSAGTLSRKEIARLFRRMIGQLKDGLRMTVKHMIGEGDCVAVEVESYGELKNGRVYNQEYHFVLELRDGKICSVREYLDTQHVMEVWFQR